MTRWEATMTNGLSRCEQPLVDRREPDALAGCTNCWKGVQSLWIAHTADLVPPPQVHSLAPASIHDQQLTESTLCRWHG